MTNITFITPAEAKKLTGKSQATISNFCRKHKESKHIKKQGNKYLIDKVFLLSVYPLISIKDEVNINSEQTDITNINEYQVNINELKKELSESKKKITEYIDAISIQQDNINEYQANINELKKQIEVSNAEKKKDTEIIEILKAEIKELKEDKKEKDKQISELHFMLAKDQNRVVTETTEDNKKNAWQRFLHNFGLIQD